MDGYLDKWTNGLNGWQARFVVVDATTQSIRYYTSKKYSNKPCRGQMSLIGAALDVDDNQLLKFSVTDSRNTVFRFQAPSAQDRETWVQVLESIITPFNPSSSYNNINSCESVSHFPDSKAMKNTVKNNGIINNSDDNDSDFKSLKSNDDSDISRKLADLSLRTSSDSLNCYDDEIDMSSFIEKDVVGSSSSVISHLLSQIKIGMDLTTITLPTYILEPRSLLEMYSEFFSHPYLFTAVTKSSGPVERFLAMLKMYLSSFHSARKGTIAKKPYNPILGEIFQCFYDLSSDIPPENKTPCGQGSPVPWANDSDLTFIAEQVSHHPPISAFYVESIKHRVCFNAHIHTKSKFLGISIAVHNIGQATTYLLDHNEEYILTFPSGYARSIFSVPWLELVGDCELKCPQTGLSATIKFHSKPFYGGKKNCVTVNVYNGDKKIPLFLITGLWNDKFIFNDNIDDRNDENVFLDVNEEIKYRRYVLHRSKQKSNESRRIWDNVTNSLINDDINNASNYKFEIENNQRKLAKYRKENNQKFEPKHFYSTKYGGWMYKNPLYTRVNCSFSWNSS